MLHDTINGRLMSSCVGGTAATVISLKLLRTRMISQGEPKVGRGYGLRSTAIITIDVVELLNILLSETIR